MSEKLMYDLVYTLALLRVFLIGSCSFLQVRRTTIKSRMRSKFGPIRPRTTEVAALERLKNPHRLKMGDIAPLVLLH